MYLYLKMCRYPVVKEKTSVLNPAPTFYFHLNVNMWINTHTHMYTPEDRFGTLRCTCWLSLSMKRLFFSDRCQLSNVAFELDMPDRRHFSRSSVCLHMFQWRLPWLYVKCLLCGEGTQVICQKKKKERGDEGTEEECRLNPSVSNADVANMRSQSQCVKSEVLIHRLVWPLLLK